MTPVNTPKRCTRCGVVRAYRPRIRFCRERRFGKGSYWCHGLLESVVPVTPVARPPSGRRPQDVAAAKLKQTELALDAAHDEMFTLAARLGTLTTRVRALSAKARQYAAQASMSEAEVQAQRDQRLARVQARAEARRNRRIELSVLLETLEPRP